MADQAASSPASCGRLLGDVLAIVADREEDDDRQHRDHSSNIPSFIRRRIPAGRRICLFGGSRRAASGWSIGSAFELRFLCSRRAF